MLTIIFFTGGSRDYNQKLRNYNMRKLVVNQTSRTVTFEQFVPFLIKCTVFLLTSRLENPFCYLMSHLISTSCLRADARKGGSKFYLAPKWVLLQKILALIF